MYLFMNIYALPSGPIDHQLSVTGDEAVSEASDVDEPANAEGQTSIESIVCIDIMLRVFVTAV